MQQNCHPDRSAAQWRDLLLLFQFSQRLFRRTLSRASHGSAEFAIGCDITWPPRALNSKASIS